MKVQDTHTSGRRIPSETLSRGQSASVTRKSPRLHQKTAVNEILRVLSQPGDDVRASGVMACGTGKTLVGLWVPEKLGSTTTLLVEPSLALIAQNLKEWRANYSGDKPEFLVVCSDETTVQINSDEPILSKEDLGGRVTNNPNEIAAFLRDKSTKKILQPYTHSLLLVRLWVREGLRDLTAL